MVRRTDVKRLSYTKELAFKEFEKVRPLLDGARRTTRPKIHDTYAVFCAILYIVRGGVSWRKLPDWFPPWRSVHQHFIQWAPTAESKTCLEEALEALGLHDVAADVRLQINNRNNWPMTKRRLEHNFEQHVPPTKTLSCNVNRIGDSNAHAKSQHAVALEAKKQLEKDYTNLTNG